MLNMEIEMMQKLGQHVPVTVLQLSGKLDGSNYLQLVNKAKEIYQNGVRDLLIDMSRLTYLSSAGLSAIHKTALIFRGLTIPEDESGWGDFHAIDRDRSNGTQKHVKLLSPQPDVAHTLDITGFKALFEIHTDLNAAIASFE
jgi:anti-anti-sigma regulatory factor